MSPFDPLSEDVRREVRERWRLPCENMYEFLVRNHEAELCTWVASGALQDTDLTFAAEALGDAKDSDAARVALLPLLDAPSSLIREGAIYGLARHMNETVAARLAQLAVGDPSPAIRECAREALES